MATLTFSAATNASLSTLRQLSLSSFVKKAPSIQPFSSPGAKPPLTLKTINLNDNQRSPSPICSSSSTSAHIADAAGVPQSLKARLKNGETLYGIFLLSFSPTIAEIAGLAGYDFAVVDMEHGPGGIADALSCLRALKATNTAAILRVPETSDTWAKKALDLGPEGIMFPMIDSPKAARKAVSYCRFPPKGVRGSAHTVVRASSYGIDEGYLSNYEDELLIMCQVECQEGVKKIEEIAAVEGVDCIEMGPLDLSASMGYLWDPGHKKVREVLRKAEAAVLSSNPDEGGAYLAGFAMPHDSPIALKSRGYHMVSGSVDTALFRNSAVDDVKKFKTSLESTEEEEDDLKVNDQKEDDDERYWSE